MKNNPVFWAVGAAMPAFTKKALPTSTTRKSVKKEYRAICRRAKNIGAHNKLLSCYALTAWFIAMNRCDGLSPEENSRIICDALRQSFIFHKIMGDADAYLDPKRLVGQKKWAEESHDRTYENDWVVDFLPGNDQYDLGYDYTECGICKMCRDEGCFEDAKYMCMLDYTMADVMGLHLDRTGTLADGAGKCDFRFSRQSDDGKTHGDCPCGKSCDRRKNRK